MYISFEHGSMCLSAISIVLSPRQDAARYRADDITRYYFGGTNSFKADGILQRKVICKISSHHEFKSSVRNLAGLRIP